MTEQTQAQLLADLLGNDGMNFEAEDGRAFEDLIIDMDADVTYARRLLDVTTEEEVIVPVARTEHHVGEPVRYLFPDGSAIVVCGDAWDIEGEAPFSWAGA